MKTADLVAGPQTDALIALVQDWEWLDGKTNIFGVACWLKSDGTIIKVNAYSPSSTRAQWAELIPLIDNIIIEQDGDWYYIYSCDMEYIQGALWISHDSNLGLAICKAVIAVKFGDEIDESIMRKIN